MERMDVRNCKEYMYSKVIDGGTPGSSHYVGWRVLFADPVWIPGYGYHPSLPTWRSESCLQQHNGKWIFDIGYYDDQNMWQATCSYESPANATDCPDKYEYTHVGTVGTLPAGVSALTRILLTGSKDPPP